MKNIITIIMLSLCLTSFSQNAVGMHYHEVVSDVFNNDTSTYKKKVLKEGEFYLYSIGEDNEHAVSYYFHKDEVCYKYIFLVEDYMKDEVVRQLNKEFKLIDKGLWIERSHNSSFMWREVHSEIKGYYCITVIKM